MARPYDPNDDDPFAPRPATTPSGASEPWRWTQGVQPPRAARPSFHWEWRGGFNDPGGQGWQEEPDGGYAGGSPFAESVQASVVPGGSGEGNRGLAYWATQGVTPDQIFDLRTGQLREGWRRVGNGYERTGPGGTTVVPITDQRDPNNPRNAPAPGPTGGPGTGGPRGGGDPFSGDSWGGMAPMLPFPEYESAGPFTPRRDTFAFDPFTPSSWADAENEPGYRASRDQLRKQVEAGAAHRGMVLSGMTIGDVYKNLDALSQQNFSQFDDRRFRNWTGNRDLAATKFGLELGVDRDIYDRRATDIDRRNNYRFNVADASFKDALARWTERTRSLTEMARPIP